MKIGLALPHYDTSLAGRDVSYEANERVALQAEQSGYDSIWVSDHLFIDWGKYGGPSEPQGSLECWTTMSALAARTKRVRLGSLTLCNDFRNPALLAKMAATLQLLSGGRLELGVGAGWYEPEYRAGGITFERAGRRIERLGESLEIVRHLLDGEELVFKGDHYTIDGAMCRPLPETPPRLWIGGKGDRLLRTVARVADGWNLSWLGTLETYEERLRAFERACEAEGREPDSVARSVGVKALVGSDDADARRRFERLVERTPSGLMEAFTEGGEVSWESFRRSHFAGSVDEVVDRLGGLKELGVEEVILSLGTLPFQVSDEEDVGIVGTEVAPQLR
jgi:probable F420-dependent oxidoreductase